MDLGVGSFVFSLGVVSSLPLLRQTDQRPYLKSVLSSIKKALPIIGLGCIRVMMVKGVEYPVSTKKNIIFSMTPLVLSLVRFKGARHRIWCSLELFLHDGAYSCLWHCARTFR